MGRDKGWELQSVVPDARIDCRQVNAMATYIEAQERLDRLQDGQVMEVLITEGFPASYVSTALREEGHRLLRFEPLAGQDGFRMWIQKSEQELLGAR